MSNIVTITFSPCIDRNISVPSLIPERKLKCTAAKLEPGGGGINVARAIKKLGGEATAIFPSGGYTGKYFNHLLEQEKISSLIIETENETRENIIVLEECTNNQYRFGMPGTQLKDNEWKQCLKALEKMHDTEYIVASGSLPPGVPLNIYAQLAKIAKQKKAKFIVDTSGEALKQAAVEGVYLLKPNLGELSTLTGIEKIGSDNVVEVSKKLVQNNSCKVIIVSLGIKGAVLVTNNETYQALPPKVNCKSTVGAGDSMVAGVVYSLSLGMNLKQALAYGVACGTAATMNPGTELCRNEDVDRLYALINTGNKFYESANIFI